MITNLINTVRELEVEDKRLLYSNIFSTGSLSSGKLSEKIEMIYLLSYLTFKMREKDKNITALDVLEKIFKRKLDKNSLGLDTYLIGLSIQSEDLLYGTTIMDKPEGFYKSQDIINRMKEILEQWFPF